MKMILNKLRPRSMVLGGFALLALVTPVRLQAQLDPSVLGPTWDFTISGNARGIARIAFNSDFTLLGALHIETRKKVGGSNDDDRAGTEGRGDGTSTNSSAASVTNFYGSADITGHWGFDPVRNQVIGFFDEASEVYIGTTTNFVVNTLTFRGVLRSGSRPRFTLHGTSVLGHQTFQGVPLQSLPDIHGDYAALGHRNSQSVTEFFTLSPLGVNTYTVVGSSPNLTFAGTAILSARKQLSMVALSQGTNATTVTMVVGSFNTNKLTGRLHGRDGNGPVSLRVFSTGP